MKITRKIIKMLINNLLVHLTNIVFVLIIIRFVDCYEYIEEYIYIMKKLMHLLYQ